MMQYLSLLYLELITETFRTSKFLNVIFIKFIYLDLSGPAIYRQNYLKFIHCRCLKNKLKLFIFQDCHGDYNVGPIMLFC